MTLWSQFYARVRSANYSSHFCSWKSPGQQQNPLSSSPTHPTADGSQAISFTSSCASSSRLVSFSSVFQGKSGTCMKPLVTALCNTGKNCLMDGCRQHLRETLHMIKETFLPHLPRRGVRVVQNHPAMCTFPAVA